MPQKSLVARGLRQHPLLIITLFPIPFSLIMIKIVIIDCGANLSDHINVMALFDLSNHLPSTHQRKPSRRRSPQRFSWLWDKAYLPGYYEASRIHLSVVSDLNPEACGENCSNTH